MKNISDIHDRRIGRILKREREAKHLTLDQLSTHIGCARPTLNLYETGKRTITSKWIPALADALEIDPLLITPEAA